MEPRLSSIPRSSLAPLETRIPYQVTPGARIFGPRSTRCGLLKRQSRARRHSNRTEPGLKHLPDTVCLVTFVLVWWHVDSTAWLRAAAELVKPEYQQKSASDLSKSDFTTRANRCNLNSVYLCNPGVDRRREHTWLFRIRWRLLQAIS